MFNKKQIMKRAWEIFVESYDWPNMKFTSIGRKCFGGALAKAWREAKEITRLAVLPKQTIVDRIEEQRTEIAMLIYKYARYSIGEMRRSLETEISTLTNALEAA